MARESAVSIGYKISSRITLEVRYAYLFPVSSANSLTDTLGSNLCPTFSLGIEQLSPTQLPYPGKKELCGDVCSP
jgi:hypothetical protein